MPKIPTLTTAAWLNDGASKLVDRFDNYVAADASQSYIYNGKVISFQNTIKVYQNNPVGLAYAVRDELEAYLKPYFESVTIDVRADDPDDSGKYNLNIRVVAVEGGISFSLGRSLELLGSRLVTFHVLS